MLGWGRGRWAFAQILILIQRIERGNYIHLETVSRDRSITRISALFLTPFMRYFETKCCHSFQVSNISSIHKPLIHDQFAVVLKTFVETKLRHAKIH